MLTTAAAIAAAARKCAVHTSLGCQPGSCSGVVQCCLHTCLHNSRQDLPTNLLQGLRHLLILLLPLLLCCCIAHAPSTGAVLCAGKPPQSVSNGTLPDTCTITLIMLDVDPLLLLLLLLLMCWTMLPPTGAVLCAGKPPQSVSNGTFPDTCTNTAPGGSCTARCNTGYAGVPAPNVMCRADAGSTTGASWSPTVLGSCIPGMLGVLHWVHCIGCTALGVLRWLYCMGCTALGVLHWVYCVGYTALVVLHWVYCVGCTALVVLHWLYYIGCTALGVLRGVHWVYCMECTVLHALQCYRVVHLKNQTVAKCAVAAVGLNMCYLHGLLPEA